MYKSKFKYKLFTMEDQTQGFAVADFIVFFGMLTLAALIGVYYAIKDRKAKHRNTDNYNYGGRSMSPVPLGLSIAVTYMSAITMTGYPTEAYYFGTVVIWYLPASIIANWIACLYYIPLIHKLQLRSIYEYLEYRFDSTVRKLASALAVFGMVALVYMMDFPNYRKISKGKAKVTSGVSLTAAKVSVITEHLDNDSNYTSILLHFMIFYMGINVYLPALALNAVTLLSLNWCIVLTSGICTFYTSLGGLKAVVWTDTVQAIIMFVGSFAAMVRTVSYVGGFGNVWIAMERGGRLNMWDFNPDPTLQRTFWTGVFGLTFTSVQAICCTQATAQRFLSCSSVKDARITSIVSVFPKLVITLVAMFCGFTAYAYFESCDPLKSGKTTKSDQLMAYLVAKVFHDTPGMTGLFVSAVFSGTLSTVSSGINSSGMLILEDFILARKPHLGESAKVTISKAAGVLLGCLVTAVAFVTKTVGGTVMSILLSITGATSGPLLAVFTLGIFFPWTNTKGALLGQLFASSITSWIAISSVIYGKPPEKIRLLPTSIEGCSIEREQYNFTTLLPTTNVNNLDIFEQSPWTNISTEITSTIATDKPPFYYSLYSLSFMYSGTLSFILTLIVGLLASFATGATDPSKSNPRYFLPFIDNRLLPQKVRSFFRFGVPEEETKAYENREEIKLSFLTSNALDSHPDDCNATTLASQSKVEKLYD